MKNAAVFGFLYCRVYNVDRGWPTKSNFINYVQLFYGFVTSIGTLKGQFTYWPV